MLWRNKGAWKLSSKQRKCSSPVQRHQQGLHPCYQLPVTHAPGAPTTGYLSPTLQGHQPPAIYLSPTFQGHQPPATSHPRSRGTNHQLPLTRSRGTNLSPALQGHHPPVTALQGHQPPATSHPRSRGTKHQPSSDSMWFNLMEWCTGVTNPYPCLLYPPLRSCLHLCQIASAHKNRHFAFWIFVHVCKQPK